MVKSEFTKKEEILLKEYEVVNAKAIDESNFIWKRFEIFILINTILVSLGGGIVIFRTQVGLGVIDLTVLAVVSFLGLIFSLAWRAMYPRG